MKTKITMKRKLTTTVIKTLTENLRVTMKTIISRNNKCKLLVTDLQFILTAIFVNKHI